MEVRPLTIWGDNRRGPLPEGGRLDTAFLQLLVAEMRYQDPLSPPSSKDIVSQLFILASLERAERMEEKLAELSKVQAILLVGKEVGFVDPSSGEEGEGVVERVKFGEELRLIVSGREIGLSDIRWVAVERG